MNNYRLIVEKLTKRKFFKYGVPFVSLIVIGSFGLKEFSQIRYQFTKKSVITDADAEKYGIKMKKRSEVTLEAEYEKIKNLDINNWENKRGPRPWEENIS